MPSEPPRWLLVHLALILGNSLFGFGAIIGTVGLSGMNPLQFSLVRATIAGILLLLLSLMVKCIRGKYATKPSETEPLLIATTIEEYNYNRILQSGRGFYKEEYEQNYYRCMPQTKEDWKSFLVLGFLVSSGLGAYLCGLQLAGPIAGSIWQPSMPVWTVAISMMLKLETFQMWRIIGVFVAFGGYAGMILMNSSHSEEENSAQVHSSRAMFLLGNFLFFSSCIWGSCFVLFSKNLLKVYPSLTVTAWSYIHSVPFLLVATIGSWLIPSWQSIVCPDCIPWDGSLVSLFLIPKNALPALMYYILFMSVGAWGLILWANQHVTGTLVVGYSVVQPIISTVFVVLSLAMGWYPDCRQDLQIRSKGQICLSQPGVGAFAGTIGILVGLALIIRTEPKRDEPRNPQWQGLKVLSIETNFTETHNAIYGSIVSNGSTSLLRPT